MSQNRVGSYAAGSGPASVPTVSPGVMLIRHYAGAGVFAEVSCYDVLAGALRSGDLDGKIALLVLQRNFML